MAKSCSMIAQENSSAADWVVTKVQLAMAGVGFSASIGLWGTWTRLQNGVIRFIIDPIDNFMTKAPSSKSIVSKILSAQVALSAVKAYDAEVVPGNKAVLKAGENAVPRIELFFNKPITEALTTDNAAKIPGDLDVIVVLPGEAAPPEDARGPVLDDEYRALFFEAIDAATAPTTAAAPTTGAASSGAAASTGGKKKRKTMKKKHHKKRNKKHARKTGKKKMHKKKGKKTAKKHHKKHNKKHHKKRGRKTRKH